MINMIKETKTKVLAFMEQEIGKYGGSRMDVKEIGDLADVVKDLAMAEYYCTVSEAMSSGSSGYSQPTQSRMSYNAMPSNSTNGYGMTNQNDPISIIRDTLSTASPEMRAQLRNEISGFMNM